LGEAMRWLPSFFHNTAPKTPAELFVTILYLSVSISSQRRNEKSRARALLFYNGVLIVTA
jgi:hypothetical protein